MTQPPCQVSAFNDSHEEKKKSLCNKNSTCAHYSPCCTIVSAVSMDPTKRPNHRLHAIAAWLEKQQIQHVYTSITLVKRTTRLRNGIGKHMDFPIGSNSTRQLGIIHNSLNQIGWKKKKVQSPSDTSRCQQPGSEIRCP